MKTNLKIILTLTLVLAIGITGLLIYSFQGKQNPSFFNREPLGNNEIRVSTSFYLIFFLTKSLAPDNFVIQNIIPAGQEPHEYELTPSQISAMSNSKVIFYNGYGVDTSVEKSALVLDKSETRVVQLTENIDIEKDAIGNIDPHLWLNPLKAERYAGVIASTLIDADSTQIDVISKKLELLRSELTKLDSEYTQGLENCEIRSIITSHKAFGYMAKRYNFEQISISGFSPEEEPSNQQLSELIALAKDKKIQTVFFESGVSTKLADVVNRELNGQILELNPIESPDQSDLDQGENYFSFMRKNLTNLKTAMKCR
jgi:zinc transport system substrate-binding protein